MNTTKILIRLNDFMEDLMKAILNQNDEQCKIRKIKRLKDKLCSVTISVITGYYRYDYRYGRFRLLITTQK